MINKLYFNSNYEESLLFRIKEEKNKIGHYNLPQQDTTYISNYLKELDKIQKINSINDIVIIGIGGSSLGIKSIYYFIQPVRKLNCKIHFIDSTDSVTINNICSNLDIKSTHFFIISKSGETIETIALYKYILTLINDAKLDYLPLTFITDKNSLLEQHAKKNNALVVNIQDNISGRFSVLSSVGIIPLALAGIEIDNLLKGAYKIQNSFFCNGYIQDILLKKAYFYAENSIRYNINAIFSYTDSLKYFNDWYVQLWGESLGKRQNNSAFNVGLTPIGLIGPKDQHSFLQLLLEGTRDKSVTFIKLENFNFKGTIPDITLEKLENLNIINNVNFSDLINMQANSIIQTIKNHNLIPSDEIIIKQQDEFNIGQLIYYYELLTSSVGDLLNINTYNQPAVEFSKNILINKLKKI